MFAADEEADEEWSTTESVKMPDTSVRCQTKSLMLPDEDWSVTETFERSFFGRQVFFYRVEGCKPGGLLVY